MTWTRDQYIATHPDGPEGPGAQRVDESAFLRSWDAHEALMARCRCDWDADADGASKRLHNPACGVHELADVDEPALRLAA